MQSQIKTIGFFYRENHSLSKVWENKIVKWLKNKYPKVKVVRKHPEFLIVLGGDGTILEAVRKFAKNTAPTILGLNLGHVGFLASIRNPKNFLTGLDKLFKEGPRIIKKLMVEVEVIRNNKKVFRTNAFNDVVVENPLGVVEIEVKIEKDTIQCVRGTGVMVSTASGSTAFNLSAHGPIVMPDIKCLIVTEIMDHNIPTPSIIVKRNREIEIKIASFRERKLISLTKTKEPFDVLLIADGENLFPLKEKDAVLVRRSSRLVKFAELEKNYFFKSLQEKFYFG